MVDFKVVKLQGSVFTPEFSMTKSMLILNSIQEIMGSLLDGDISVLPIPQDAPKEIPRIQLYSENKKWCLQVSLQRTDLIFMLSPAKANQIGVFDKFSDTCSDFFPKYQENLGLRVQRLSFVSERAMLNPKPSYFLINKFCKDEFQKEGRPFNNVSKFELHSLKKYSWHDFDVNSWVRLKSIDFMVDDSLMPALLLVNDLNTLSESEAPEKDFSAKDIESFFQHAHAHLDEIYSKYFE